MLGSRRIEQSGSDRGYLTGNVELSVSVSINSPVALVNLNLLGSRVGWLIWKVSFNVISGLHLEVNGHTPGNMGVRCAHILCRSSSIAAVSVAIILYFNNRFYVYNPCKSRNHRGSPEC